jgi:hypothetical protein
MENGWNEWSKHVLRELERLDKYTEKLDERDVFILNKIEERIRYLKNEIDNCIGSEEKRCKEILKLINEKIINLHNKIFDINKKSEESDVYIKDKFDNFDIKSCDNLTKLEARIDDLYTKYSSILEEIGKLKGKSGFWGLIGGLIPALVAIIILIISKWEKIMEAL